MRTPFVVPEGVTLHEMWDWMKENKTSLWFSPWIGVWIAQDGFDSPEAVHHQALGHSPEQALYMLMVLYLVVPMPKKDAA